MMPQDSRCVSAKHADWPPHFGDSSSDCHRESGVVARSKSIGQRFDEGKSRVDLLPADALMEVGAVYAAGAKKYGDRNWEKGMKWTRMLGPLLRHLFQWMRGIERDEETGQRHIAMVVWNALGLLTYELRGIGEDDRK